MKYWFLLAVTLLIACDQQRVYEENAELENGYWLADSAKRFTFSIEDTTSQYNVYYNIRNTISYPFQNIYIDYVLADSAGRQIEGDLINQNLFHPRTGEPFGSGLGDVFDHQFLLLSDYEFPVQGAYTVSIRQYMRRDTLKDILSVGLRVENTTDND